MEVQRGNFDKLLFRRQFILGQNYVEDLTGWNRLKIGNKLYLTYHPDLEVTQVDQNGAVLTLLGYLINPYQPNNSNEENLKQLFINVKSFEDIKNNTFLYSGRWAIIYHSSTETKIMHDPCGMRQVYYTKTDSGVWCGSQPSILAKILDKEKDYGEDILDFINSSYFENEERALFGDGTIYKDIYHLIPNHLLDLREYRKKRFWIDEEKNKDIDSIVEEAGEILKGSLRGLNHRNKMMLAVTAGWDSRVLLAASKEIKDDIHYFVSTMNSLNLEHMDIKIPKRLLKKINLELEVINNVPPLRPEFEEYLKNNISMARKLPKTLTIQYHYDYSGDKVIINGNGSEIVRSYYGKGHPKSIDGKYLAKLTGYPNVKYIISQLDEWLIEAKEVSRKNNIDLMDLFYWEQRMGNWGTMYQAEQDIAVEEFSPFNNRKLLMTLLKADEKYRKDPNYELYRRLIEHLWADTLSEPINPLSFKGKVKNKIRNIIPQSAKINLKALVKRYRKNEHLDKNLK